MKKLHLFLGIPSALALVLVLGSLSYLYFYGDKEVDASILTTTDKATIIEEECQEGTQRNGVFIGSCKRNPDLRFAVIGDTGSGSKGGLRGGPNQKWVGEAMAKYCQSNGCEFVHMVGDNIYPNGVTTETAEAEFHDKFHDPYNALEIPFWAALGNHDYGGDPVVGGAGLESTRAQAQIDYANSLHNQTDHENKFRLPDNQYVVTFGNPKKPYSEHYIYDTALANLGIPHLTLTTPPSDPTDDPTRQVQRAWKFAFGHHNYISNGRHSVLANALSGGINPTGDQTLIENEICGKADIYFAGHEHSAEMLLETCGPNNGKQTLLAISGTGYESAKRSADPAIKPPFLHKNRFYDEDSIGFLWVNANDDTLTMKFIGCDRFKLKEPLELDPATGDYIPAHPANWCEKPDHVGDDNSLGTEAKPWYTLFAMKCTRSAKEDTGLQNCVEIQPDRTPNPAQ